MSARMVRTVEAQSEEFWMDLWWKASGDDWPVPEDLPKRFAALVAESVVPAIDPDDEALVEKVARAAFLADNRGRRTAAAEWDNRTMIPPVYEAHRTIARAALKAVTS